MSTDHRGSVPTLTLALLAGAITAQLPQVPLDANLIPKYVDALPHFSGVRVDGTQALTVTMSEFQQDVLPDSMYAGLPTPFRNGTYVWGYGIYSFDGRRQLAPPLYPGYTVEAKRGTPTRVRYVNNLTNPVLQQYLLVDQTLHWANPLGSPVGDALSMPYVGPVPAVVHLHGGESPSGFDGGPDQWFTASGLRGPGYHSLAGARSNEAIYQYGNSQEATTLWFHDHTLGATRLNVYAGLAAFWFLRDDSDCGHNYYSRSDDSRWRNSFNLPADPYEIEVAIQDRSFDTNGQWYFPNQGDNPEHPFWVPEFLGDAIVVNGKTWPYLNVEPRRYRFRFLNGSNARFYNMRLVDNSSGNAGPAFWQIGTDGGLLDQPVKIDPNDRRDPRTLLMAPGERADLIIDFSQFAGRTLRLTNDANSPFPFGDPVVPGLTDQIMQFRVNQPLRGRDRTFDPACGRSLRSRMTNLASDLLCNFGGRRLLTLNEVMADNGPLGALLNNTNWSGRMGGHGGTPVPRSTPDGHGNFVTETPRMGSTELWQIANLTADAHPIHLHLVQFQVLARQAFDPAYAALYESAFASGMLEPEMGPPLDYVTGNPSALGGNPEVMPFLVGRPRAPEPNETGWKDTVVTYPGEVTSIIVRFAPQGVRAGSTRAGRNYFPFDPTAGPGYVWHCHIIDHEDNEMMRPMLIRN